MWNSRNRGGVGVLCLLALIGQSALRTDANQEAAKADDKPVTLAPTVKTGDVTQYKSVLELSFSGADVKVEQERKHTVKEIKENGEVVIIVSSLGGKIVANGADNEFPPGSPTTVTQTKSGKVLTYKPEVEDNPYLSTTTQHLLLMVDRIVFPDKPVKPGDSWTTEVENPQVKGKKVTIKTTFVKADKVENMAVWKMKQTVEADTEVADSKMKAEVNAVLEAANGQLVSAEQEVKGIPGTMGPMDWKAVLKRVKPEASKEEKKPAAP